MAARPLVTYEDFSGGEWGRLGPRKAAKNQFHGLNVLVYADGQIGPRPGMTSLARGAAVGMVTPSAKPHSMGRRAGTGTVWWSYVDSGNLFVGLLDSTRKFAVGNPSYYASLTPTTLGTADRGQSYDEPDGSQSFFASQDNGWIIDYTLGAVGKIAGPAPSGRTMAMYGDRLIIGQGATLRYSAAADPITWPAANSIIVGRSNIRGLYVVRGSLIIVKDDYAVWVLTGVPGVNETLRQVLPRHSGHIDTFDFEAGDVDALGRLWMTFPGADAPSNVTPALFAGSVPQNFREHEQNAYREPDAYVKWSSQNTARAQVVGLRSEDAVAMFAASNQTAGEDGNLLVRHNGVWTKHLIQWPDSSHTLFATHVGDGRVIVATENTAGMVQANQFWEPWSCQVAWDRIPVLGDDFYELMSLGDGSDTPVNAYFQLSEWWEPEGRDVMPREVVVDVTIADIATPGGLAKINSSFDFTMVTLGLDPGGDTRGATDRLGTGAVHIEIDPTAEGAGAGSHDPDDPGFGLRRTVRIPVNPVQGRGFKLRFDNIVGCSFRRITVFGELDSPRA